MNKQSITVNNQEIEIVTENGERFVAIKPICKAVGVDYEKQFEKIKNDKILGQAFTLKGIVAADGKERKMLVLPILYVFGWLFTINPNKVKPEIQDTIIKYKMECYHALFSRFTKRDQILKERSSYKTEIAELEKELKQNEYYQKITELKKHVKRTNKQLKEMDRGVVNEQLTIPYEN